MINNIIHWNIAGGFTHFNIIKNYINKNKNINYKFSVYDGLNLCGWNGGRINRPIFYNPKYHQWYKDNNIGINLTFSNYIIDLNDKTGNELLDTFHDENNSIILINDNLKKYIRKNYPKYKLIYSITGIFPINVPMQDYDIDYYKKLEQNYDYIVLRTEHVFDKRMTELNTNKYEIITNINTICKENCSIYREHYELMSKINRDYYDQNPWDVLGYDYCKNIEECIIHDFDPLHIVDLNRDDEIYHIRLSNKQINKLINMNYNKFKIAGRELDSIVFLDHVKYNLNNKRIKI